MGTRKIEQIGKVQVRWDASTREFVCRIPGNRAADYFTPDREDAFATARDMSARLEVGR
jgi:hypothetical protein